MKNKKSKISMLIAMVMIAACLAVPVHAAENPGIEPFSNEDTYFSFTLNSSNRNTDRRPKENDSYIYVDLRSFSGTRLRLQTYGMVNLGKTYGEFNQTAATAKMVTLTATRKYIIRNWVYERANMDEVPTWLRSPYSSDSGYGWWSPDWVDYGEGEICPNP